jgi:hypothetical protein
MVRNKNYVSSNSGKTLRFKSLKKCYCSKFLINLLLLNVIPIGILHIPYIIPGVMEVHVINLTTNRLK